MRRAVAVALAAVAVFAAGVVLNGVPLAGRLAWDLTAERSATLSGETLRVLEQVRDPIQISAFFRRDEIGRAEAVTLLSRYRRANRRISFRILDPTQVPGEAMRLGVVASRAAGLRMDGRTEVAQDVIEIDLTSAIARLLRESSGTVCFTTGHGERAFDDGGRRGVSLAAQMLRDNGYDVLPLDLLADPHRPDGCDAVIVAAPAAPFDEASGALRDYLARAGKIMLLADPETPVDLSGISEPWGITFDRGIVLEGDPDSRMRDDPTTPILTRFFGGNASVRGLPPTLHPGVQAVVVHDPGRESLSVAPLAQTSPRAYLERDPGEQVVFAPDIALPGPVVVGAAADDSRVEDPAGRPAIRRTRVLAWGDVDFASNAFFGDGGNARLMLQAVDWLTQPEPLIGAVPGFPSPRELQLTQARENYMAFVTAAVVPGVFLLSGGLVWALRRGR